MTVVLTFCGGLIICIRYCMMHSKVTKLQSRVSRMYSEAGLPEDYNYEQDAIYQQELAEER